MSAAGDRNRKNDASRATNGKHSSALHPLRGIWPQNAKTHSKWNVNFEFVITAKKVTVNVRTRIQRETIRTKPGPFLAACLTISMAANFNSYLPGTASHRMLLTHGLNTVTTKVYKVFDMDSVRVKCLANE